MEEMRMRGAVGGIRRRSDLGRGRERKREGEGCALMVSPRVWAGMDGNG